ncbi:molybdate ABC transporter substrate-binding protein [Nitrospira sp. Kam-Ns4a]
MAGIRRGGGAVAAAVVLMGLVGGGGLVQAEPLTVAAAPSLKAAFQEIVPMFEGEYGTTVRVIYGPSLTVRRQIERGAAIDVFLPAAVEELEILHTKGLTLNGGPRIYAQNSLVLVMSATSPALAVSLREVWPNRTTRIALGNPRVSSLGKIAARALAHFDPVFTNRAGVLYGDDGEAVANLVRAGRAEVGILYRVDAINNGQVRIIDETLDGTFTPVQFGAAVVWTCRKTSLTVAEEFVEFMASPRIRKLLLKYGFDPVSLKG